MTDDDVNDFLEHFGVKGMRWGVRNEDESGGKDSAVQKALKENPPPKLSKKQQNQLAINEKKHDAKFDVSEDEAPKGWRPTKTQIAVVAVGAVAAGAIIYKVKTGNKLPTDGFSEGDYLKAVRSAETPSWVPGFAGKHMSRADFKGLIDNSKGRVWTGEHITAESFRHGELEFGKGHKFFRISRAVENSFSDATYATASESDFTRYLHAFSLSPALDAQRITFDAADSVKIPKLHTQLETMRRVLVGEGRTKVKPSEVIEEFSGMSGGGWSSPRARNFISLLRAQGYHGIVDQMDAGVYGETPLVLFDKTRFGAKSATPLASLDLKHYASLLTDISNRR